MKTVSKKDRVEEWRDEGVLDEKISLMRSLSMQGYTLKQIGEHEEINLSERQIIRLMKKYNVMMSPIKKGRHHVVAFAQSALMKQIEAGNTTAIIYALKVYGGEFFKENKLDFGTYYVSENGEYFRGQFKNDKPWKGIWYDKKDKVISKVEYGE